MEYTVETEAARQVVQYIIEKRSIISPLEDYGEIGNSLDFVLTAQQQQQQQQKKKKEKKRKEFWNVH